MIKLDRDDFVLTHDSYNFSVSWRGWPIATGGRRPQSPTKRARDLAIADNKMRVEKLVDSLIESNSPARHMCKIQELLELRSKTKNASAITFTVLPDNNLENLFKHIEQQFNGWWPANFIGFDEATGLCAFANSELVLRTFSNIEEEATYTAWCNIQKCTQ